MIQAHLKKGNSEQVVWVEDHPKVKKGNRISFKESTKEFWDILDTWEWKLNKQSLHKNWDVGGL